MTDEFKVLFHCGDCGKGNSDEMFDLNNGDDKDKLWKWLQIHCADGGSYETLNKIIPDFGEQIIAQAKKLAELYEKHKYLKQKYEQ